MRISIVLLMITAFAGASRAQSATPGKTPPFSIEISTSTPEVKTGSNVYLKTRLTNTSKHEVVTGAAMTTYGNTNPAYSYSCVDAKGKSLSKDYPIMGSVGDHPISTIKPGALQEEQVTLNTACDLSQPGKYTIQLSRKDVDDPKGSVAKSNTIIVTVTP